ncbi:MAG: phage portal protein family protein [Microcoleus sp.]
MAVSVLQSDLQSQINSFISRHATRSNTILQRQDGSHHDDIARYAWMLRKDPITRFCNELVFLYCYSLLGEYTHPRARVQKNVRDAIAHCKGNWAFKLKEMMTAVWFGYSWTEVAFADDPANKKILSKLRTLDPMRYTFWGKEEVEVESLRYFGRHGLQKDLDYNTGIHLVIGSEISFDENHGCGRLESAYPYWDLHQLMQPVLAIAAQRQATPILVQQTETGTAIALLNDDGTHQLNDDGTPKTIPKGMDALRKLAELGSAGVTVIDPDDKIYSIEQKVAGDFLLAVDKHCEQYRLLACLVPSTLISTSTTGVGDSGLSDRHMEIFEMIHSGLIAYIAEEIVEQLIRPMVIYNFGDVKDYGAFPIQRRDSKALEVAKIISDAIARGCFAKTDLEAANRLRISLGIGEISKETLDEFMAMSYAEKCPDR